MQSMFINYPDVVNVDDLQKMLGICKTTAYNLVKDNTIKNVKVGKKYLIPKQAVINFLTMPLECDIMKPHSRLVISKEDCKQ